MRNWPHDSVEPAAAVFHARRSRVWTVRLPDDLEAIFPDRCVGCGRGEPDGLRTLTIRRDHVVSLLLSIPLKLGRGVPVSAPCCTACARHDRRLVIRQQWLGFPYFFLMMLTSIWISKGIVSGWLWYPIAIVFMAVLSAPLFVWVALDPPRYHAYRDGDEIVHHFRSRWSAGRFARANVVDVERIG